MSRNIFKVKVIHSEVHQHFMVETNTKPSFEQLKEKVFGRLPGLQRMIQQIYYIDTEGDKISLINECDFNIYLEMLPGKTLIFDCSGSLDKKDKNFEVNSKETKPKKCVGSVHTNIICDACDDRIIGNRYMCIECDDFDLCGNCENKMLHTEHLMIRIANPATFDRRVRSHMRVLAKTIKSSMSKTRTEGPRRFGCHVPKGGAPHFPFDIYRLINGDHPLGETPLADKKCNNARDAETASLLGDIECHSKTAEKFAKASFDILSTIAQSFSGMMDPFDSECSQDTNVKSEKAGQNVNIPTANPSKDNGNSSAEKSDAFVHTPTVNRVNDNKNRSAQNLTHTSDISLSNDNLSIPDKINVSNDNAVVNDSSNVSNSIDQPSTVNIDSTNEKEEKRQPSPPLTKEEWEIVDNNENIVIQNTFTELMAELNAPQVENDGSYKVDESSAFNAIPTQSFQVRYHHDEKINEAVITMMDMGFRNESHWLTRLLESVNGDIPKALDFIQPSH